MDRPTFHESWYRVAQLRPRLRSVVQVFRQDYRGRTWHVVRDPGNNQFYRLDESAYHLVALLDGQRSVGEAWNLTNEQLGDAAPTQGEAIQLLGQLYTSNLITAELPPDAEGMFDRYKRRRQREVGGYLMNIMFARIPLFDPDRLLDRWKGAVMWVFGPVGIALWVVLLGAGAWHLAGRAGDLFNQADNVLAPGNLGYLYAAFVIAKVLHEFGHAFAVKRFGRSEHVEDEVHTIGIMLLVLMPVPYVDASSSWAFRNKWRRAFVGAAGMYVELAVAAVAAMVWARTADGTAVHAIAYNVIFIAGVSTILFNANPLIRFDGYYILSDLTETPNLYQRANDYLKYLVKRYIYGVRNPRNPAHSVGERWWLSLYGVASLIYRVFLFSGILLFVMDKLFFVGMLMAAVSVVAWLFVPLGKWVRYLLVESELDRTRGRSQLVSLAAVAGLVAAAGYVPLPDRARATGMVEPARFEPVYARADGFVRDVAATLSPADGTTAVNADNHELLAERDGLRATRQRLVAERRKARAEDVAEAQIVAEKIASIDGQLQRVQRDLDALTLKLEGAGRWVAPDGDRLVGGFVRRGEALGVVATLDDVIIRAAADQYLAPLIGIEGGVGQEVEIKVLARPEATYHGTIERVSPAGLEELPSAALGYAAGGSVATDLRDEHGTKTADPYFEVRIRPTDAAGGAPPLFAGQRVTVRFTFAKKPLMQQAWLELRRLFQQRFRL